MFFRRGRVVLTPGGEQAYKVVLEHEDYSSEHPVTSVREGEALIRDKLPKPPKPDKFRHWNPLV